MIMQVIGPIPPVMPVTGAVTPTTLFIGGVVMWVAFAIVVAAVANGSSGVRGAAAFMTYMIPVAGTIMFFAAIGLS